MRIMFVCTGNICRSPLAHALFQKFVDDGGFDDRFDVESAGTHAYHLGENADPRMRRTAAKHGVRVDHRVKHLSSADLQHYDLILAMDRSHLDHIRRVAEQTADVVARVELFRMYDPALHDNAGRNDQSLDVPDPYYGGPDGFENVFAIVERTCRSLLSALTAAAAPDQRP